MSCVSTLDWLTPREAAEQYGTLNQRSTGPTEEEEERRKERKIRQMIRNKLQEDKSEWKRKKSKETTNNCTLTADICTSMIFAGLSLRTRRAWGSNTKPDGARGGGAQTKRPNSGLTFSSWPSLSWPLRAVASASCLSLDRGEPGTEALSVERLRVSSSSR